MNDQNQPINPNNTQSSVPTTPAPVRNQVIDRILPVLHQLFDKFYSKKIVFWPVTIFVSIVLLIIITGSIFGTKRTNTVALPSATRPPFILATPTTTTGDDVISVSQQKLDKLKDQLDKFDPNQKRLQPPTLNFEVKF